MNKAHKQLLKENYEKACNEYVKALMTQWNLDTINGSWVADEVGGVYDYNGWLFFNMADIVYCVENNVSLETYDEWQEYNVTASKYELNNINLKSWCNGCPRLSKEQLEDIENKRRELEELCEQYKNNVNTSF